MAQAPPHPAVVVAPSGLRPAARRLAILGTIAEVGFALTMFAFLFAATIAAPTGLEGSQLASIGVQVVVALIIAAGLPRLRRWAWYGALLLAAIVLGTTWGGLGAIVRDALDPTSRTRLVAALVFAHVALQTIVLVSLVFAAIASRERAA